MTSEDPLAMFGLDGTVALVTGASSGIGDRIARVLHGAGATVVAAARRKDRLVALAVESCGRLDVLVDNAGIAYPYPAEDGSLEHWPSVIEVDQTAVFHLSQLAGRGMLAQGSGVVVNVASILGLVASGQIPQVSYAASMGAVVNMTRELAVQWARRGSVSTPSRPAGSRAR